MEVGNEVEEVIAKYDRIIRRTPGDAGALFTRGAIYEALCFYSEAIRDYTKAITVGFQVSHAYYALAQVYMKLGDHKNGKLYSDRGDLLWETESPEKGERFHHQLTWDYHLWATESPEKGGRFHHKGVWDYALGTLMRSLSLGYRCLDSYDCFDVMEACPVLECESCDIYIADVEAATAIRLAFHVGERFSYFGKCPACGKFARKVADVGCPYHAEWRLDLVEVIPCARCGSLCWKIYADRDYNTFDLCVYCSS